MLIPILLLYASSNRVSTNVVENELYKSSMNQLIYFQNQVDSNINRLSLFPNILGQDPDVLSLQEIFLQSDILELDTITVIKQIQNKLSILSNSSNWQNQLYVYSPSVKKVVSTDPAVTYQEFDESVLKSRLEPGWSVRANDLEGAQYDFHWYTVTPFSAIGSTKDAKLIIEVGFSGNNIKDMLDEFKQGGGYDPFLFHRDEKVLYNRTAKKSIINKLLIELKNEPFLNSAQQVMQVGNQEYLVNYVKSENMEWYLIDYVPLEEIFQPIKKSNQLFYLSIAILLIMSSTAAYLLYNQVQIPIREFVRGFQSLKNEDYSVRMERKGTSEFGFLFKQFNVMAARLEELIEHVYLEKIRLKEAKLKQLQSQINPHFFYNCFNFISSMAKLKDHTAVIAMSQNLAKYYRYTTRQEKNFVPLREEVQFVTHYLEIQAMRMKRIDYSIDIPKYMMNVEIPPLTLQPLIENAVIHGIETDMNAGKIHIKGKQQDQEFHLIVEDDGGGMTEAEMARLMEKLSIPMDEDMGCGLWNVHQRLVLHYGGDAGIEMGQSALGGFRIMLRWSIKDEYSIEGRNEA